MKFSYFTLYGLIFLTLSLFDIYTFAEGIDREKKVVTKKKVDKELVSAAKKYIGVEYKWGGRLTKKLPGLDCLGLIFKSIEDITGISWKKWSVYPTKLIKQLGGESKIVFLNEENPLSNVSEGDILFFLWTSKNDDEVAAYDKEGNSLYVWHTAIYIGDGKIIHCSPFKDETGQTANKVLIESVIPFMERTAFVGFLKVPFKKDVINQMEK